MQEKLNKERELRQARPGWQPFFRLQRSCSVSLAEERPRDERGPLVCVGFGTTHVLQILMLMFPTTTVYFAMSSLKPWPGNKRARNATAAARQLLISRAKPAKRDDNRKQARTR